RALGAIPTGTIQRYRVHDQGLLGIHVDWPQPRRRRTGVTEHGECGAELPRRIVEDEVVDRLPAQNGRQRVERRRLREEDPLAPREIREMRLSTHDMRGHATLRLA